MFRTELVPLVKEVREKALGFDKLWDDLERFNFHADSTFPKENIIKGENTVIVELALAGYKKDQISIERDGNLLTISGTAEEVSEDDFDMQYVRRNIAKRSFTRSFTVASEYSDIHAKFEDGLLSIQLERQPEETDKKLIEIK